MLLHGGPQRLSGLVMGCLVGLLTILSVASGIGADKAAKTGERWIRKTISDWNSENQDPSVDVNEFNGLNRFNRAPVVTPDTHDGQRRSIDDEQKRVKDYVVVPQSSNAFARRQRRPMNASAGPLKAVVDTLVVVDNELYIRFLKRQKNNVTGAIQAIRTYYRHVFTQIDSIYSNLQDSDLSIRVRLVGIFIAQNWFDSLWYDRNTTVFLEHFREWLVKERGNLPKFDHAMAFTGHRLTKIAGLAYGGAICSTADGHASSLIYEYGGLSSAYTAVHELGHNLGSLHDGKDPNEACPETQEYIMVPIPSGYPKSLENFFLFSPCSIRQFKDVFSSERAECLFDSVADKISVLPGQFISPNDQCEDAYGHTSRRCILEDTRHPKKVCTQIQCLHPTNASICLLNPALSPVLGTPCADGKVCKNGHCLDKTAVLESLKEVEANADHTKSAVKGGKRRRSQIEISVKHNSVDQNAGGHIMPDLLSVKRLRETRLSRYFV